MKKITILLSLLFFIPNLVLASDQWWCGYHSRIYKCYWSALTGQLEIPEADKLLADIFPDVPIMAEVAKAESGGKQFRADGSVVIGPKNKNGTYDIGLLQINSSHIPKAKKFGYDVFTLEGNVAMGRMLYDNGGLRHWKASEKNWNI